MGNEKTKDLINLIEKSILGTVAAFYLAGVTVVCLHLASLGTFSSISLFRLNYILTGIVSFLPLFSLSIIPSSIVMIVVPLLDKKASRDENLPPPIFSGLHFMDKFYWFSPLFFAAGSIPPILEISQRLHLPNIYAWRYCLWPSLFLAVAFGTFLMTFFPASGKKKNFEEAFYPLSKPIWLLATLLSFIVYLSVFSRTVYPLIPASLGGGKPVLVKFILTEKNDALVREFLPKGTNATNATLSGKLLYVNESDYIFLVKAKEGLQAISVKKDLVEAIHFPN